MLAGVDVSIPLALSVVLSTSRNPCKNITNEVRDLVVRWTDPGGYQSCQVSLDRPLSLQPDEVAYYGTLTVTDGRNNSVVWDGRQEDPGRSAGRDGQVWDLVAVGGQAHTRDRIVPLIYVDQPLSGLERVDNITPGGSDQVGADPGDTAGIRQALVLRIPQGTDLVTGSQVVVRYNDIARAGQKLARVSFSWDAGFTSAAVSIRAIARTDGSLASGETAVNTTWNVAGGTAAVVVPTDWTAGRNTIDLKMIYTSGAGTVTADTWWQSIYNLVVVATRYTAAGTEQLTATPYGNSTVLASEVVADLLGRLLTAYDGAGASIDTTAYAIDQLAYPDGVDANRVLTDLMGLEAGYTWRVWERNSAGKYRFEWAAVPSSVRYEADVTDGYEAPGSADGLFNRVTVRWRDSGGHVRTTERTATVPALDAAGLIRQGSIDLGSDVGSVAAANRAGDQWLADRQYPPNAGRLTIARPILDLQTGRMVMPWEIRPGLIRVRGILPRVDALNATSRDGVTVFRIVASEFRASDCTATLELDSYAPSTARAQADALTARRLAPTRHS